MGSAIHAILEAETLNAPQSPPDDRYWPFIQEWHLWRAEYAPAFLGAEMTVWGDGYAGTLDAIVTIGGRTLLIDYKTGEKVYPDAALQLYAYANAQCVLLPDGTEQPLPKIDGAAILHLRPEGYRFIPAWIEGDDLRYDMRKAWEACMTLYRFHNEQADRILGLPLKGLDGARFLWPETAVPA